MKINAFILLLSTFLVSCNTNPKKETKEITKVVEVVKKKALTKGELVLKETIKAHGGDLYASANYSFEFRGNKYEFKNEGFNYEYKKEVHKKGEVIEDVLKNNKFSRKINSKIVELSDKEVSGGTGAINSVIYFATLPYKLNDKAINVKYIEETQIKDKKYDVLEITFNKEGGGEDHDDEYYYWIDKETKKIDYFAYNYQVNNGGVRFRSAYNKRIVDGITFQDYVNYKAEVGTPLKELPALFEQGKLKELSNIKTENIINLNNQ